MRLTILSILMLASVSGKAPEFPDLPFTDLRMNRVYVADHLGERFTVIDLWATWCLPCRESIPELIEMHERYADAGLKVIGISVDSPRDQSRIIPFVESMAIPYTVWHDAEERLLIELGLSGVPATYVLDSDGNIIESRFGFHIGKVRSLISPLFEDSAGE